VKAYTHLVFFVRSVSSYKKDGQKEVRQAFVLTLSF
jgi:hypothetical protein